MHTGGWLSVSKLTSSIDNRLLVVRQSTLALLLWSTFNKCFIEYLMDNYDFLSYNLYFISDTEIANSWMNAVISQFYHLFSMSLALWITICRYVIIFHYQIHLTIDNVLLVKAESLSSFGIKSYHIVRAIHDETNTYYHRRKRSSLDNEEVHRILTLELDHK